MTLREEIESILKPAIDVRAPYAKVTVTMLVEAAAKSSVPAFAEIERLKVWVADLQSGMFVNCVYCGHRYGPGETTPVSMADALKAHVAVCPEHPMSGLLTALQHARGAIASLDSVALGGHEPTTPDEEGYSFRDAMLGEIDAAIAKVLP